MTTDTQTLTRTHIRTLSSALAAIAVIASGPAYAGGGPAGVWINDTGRGAIEIKPCGQALCGHVVWVKDPADAKGCGKQIIGDAEKVGAGVWDNGWIYSPEKKARYDVELKPLDNGNLSVTGYAGTKFFSKTMIWTRAPKDLKRCGADQVAAVPPQVEAGKSPPVEAGKSKPADVAAAKPVEVPAAAATVPAQVPKSGSAPAAAAVEPQTEPKPAPAAKPAPATVTAAKPDEISAPQSGTPKAEANSPSKSEAAEAVSPAPPKSATATDHRDAAAAEADDDSDQKPAKTPKRQLRLGDLNLGDLKPGKIFKKTASGNCKVDLPWVKVSFKCED